MQDLVTGCAWVIFGHLDPTKCLQALSLTAKDNRIDGSWEGGADSLT